MEKELAKNINLIEDKGIETMVKDKA